MRRFPSLMLAMLVVSSLQARASEEDIIPWSTVRVECHEVPEAGKVTLSATFHQGRYESCEVSAFGKKYRLGVKDLARLDGFPLESLQITHEAGYPELGGHTVHFRLQKYTFTRNRKPILKQAIMSVSKGKGFSMGKSERPAS
ncbi:MAG TPA: hypothetical protein VFT74_05135 [Isosphaeraceae bacterium]|nr:hypothetical protein [Isosphaeraceae bacterium]